MTKPKKEMSKARLMSTLLILLVGWPIWYYLLYHILERVQASDIMWFLFWIYIPAQLLAGLLGAIATASPIEE